jgi:uncharacterized membrane protein YphA (DoxX/SURF4 family)
LNTALLLIRLALGLVFLSYGVLKVLGGQFVYGDFVIDSRTVDGTTMVWTFYGYSPVYGRLIGVAEIIPGVLLLLPRTRTLGALLLFPIAANITVMDFCFGFPAVKYTALVLTLLDLVLLAADHRKLKLLWQLALEDLDPRAETAPAAPQPARPRWRMAVKYGSGAAASLVVALLLTNLTLSALSNPVDAATKYCVGRGWDRQQLEVLRWKMISGSLGFNRQGFVEFQVNGKLPRVLHVEVYRPHSFVGWQILDYTENSTASSSLPARARALVHLEANQLREKLLR